MLMMWCPPSNVPENAVAAVPITGSGAVSAEKSRSAPSKKLAPQLVGFAARSAHCAVVQIRYGLAAVPAPDALNAVAPVRPAHGLAASIATSPLGLASTCC